MLFGGFPEGTHHRGVDLPLVNTESNLVRWKGGIDVEFADVVLEQAVVDHDFRHGSDTASETNHRQDGLVSANLGVDVWPDVPIIGFFEYFFKGGAEFLFNDFIYLGKFKGR